MNETIAPCPSGSYQAARAPVVCQALQARVWDARSGVPWPRDLRGWRRHRRTKNSCCARIAGAAVGACHSGVPRARRFIRDSNSIAAPLTKLHRKEGFKWCLAVEEAFHMLQRALMTVSVLQLPTFNQEFIVDCDASGSSFGAVCHQGNGSLEFFSMQVAPRHAKLATYDHFCLKYLPNQRFSTIPQH
jgi:hypothetical protein